MLEVGQVLSLKIKYNNEGLISNVKHPYLIVDIYKDGIDLVEIGQLDKIKGKEYKAYFKSNKIVPKDNETVIDEDSYIQLDNKFVIEYFDNLELFRRQTDKLSKDKLTEVIAAYNKYHNENIIDDNKCVFMTKEEILKWNC